MITAAFWIFMIPFFNKRYRQALIKYDLEIMAKICGLLKILSEDHHDNTIVRCWSCFKEIDKPENLCPFCGLQQK